MAMSKKHYNAIAARFQQQLNELDNEQAAAHDLGKISVAEWEVARRHLAGIAGKLAFALAEDNARFDKLRFLAACGF